MLNISRQFPIGIAVADQQYCVGVLERQSGYTEPRCTTTDPVNETCTIHTAPVQNYTRTYSNDDETPTQTPGETTPTDGDQPGEEAPEESDPIVSMPAVQ